MGRTSKYWSIPISIGKSSFSTCSRFSTGILVYWGIPLRNPKLNLTFAATHSNIRDIGKSWLFHMVVPFHSTTISREVLVIKQEHIKTYMFAIIRNGMWIWSSLPHAIPDNCKNVSWCLEPPWMVVKSKRNSRNMQDCFICFSEEAIQT